MNYDNLIICEGCKVPISKKRYSKHLRTGRCDAQHVRYTLADRLRRR